ncbi:hypothetical protein [uncultured Amaricoccus sp.]|uniref:hypothetical protein n=1 Tax=uncultured Amaricoccus sp. TaxID=339341 RepID=UPI002619776A|nr:hypothetical protein [uncultured Amaricoccus sp.]
MEQINAQGSGFSIQELIGEADRELALRRQFYWSRVRAGRMRQSDADKRIALMEAIVKRLIVTAAV